ncbi:MAG: GTPase RsgA, partial [Butyricicoccus sp.]|nr:GTPase RsgA [Butyricicoccus sp.]
MEKQGTILKGIGGFYYVDTADGVIECKARGKFRKTVGKPMVGDRVKIEMQPDGTGYLMEIAPRRNYLIRPALANIDLLVAVASAAPPMTDPFLVDKVIAIAENKGIEPLVVVNKTDLNPGAEWLETYHLAGID